MNLLLDTHLLVWTGTKSERLPTKARSLIAAPENRLYLSVISIWEIAIKRSLGRQEFNVDPRILRRGLIENKYVEVTVSGAHALAIDGLPLIHKDPFDRMLVAQALVEGITLLTVDRVLAQYPCPVRLV
jgi:PIN domain nuclease of toxin-antitoxin system